VSNYRLPKRITPQQEADERIFAALLRKAIERDNKLTPQELKALERKGE
jgi:hypothetical protein